MKIRIRKDSLENNLFIWGIIFAPMTALRIFKFGPGEVLLILCMLLMVYKQYAAGSLIRLNFSTIISRYQIANLVMMMIGMGTRALFYQESTGISNSLTDIFSHVFMLLLAGSIITFLGQEDARKINRKIQKITIYGAALYGFLLFYARFINTSLFGHRLWLGYYYRFLGLALNPHQIGMITGAGLFFSLYLANLPETKTREKRLLFASAVIWFIVSLSLQSDTLTLCYILLVVIYLFLRIVKSGRDLYTRRINLSILFLVCLILFIVLLPRLTDLFVGFVSEAGNGLGRVELWISGLGQFAERPVCLFTGLGPGSGTGMFMSKSGNEIEAHNTYVQQILDSGIIICLFYWVMILNLLKGFLKNNTYLLLCVLYFVLYGFGGNMNKRVLVWFTYSIVYLLFKKENEKRAAAVS